MMYTINEANTEESPAKFTSTDHNNSNSEDFQFQYPEIDLSK